MRERFSRVHACRVCGNANLVTVLELGEQMLTGVFPRRPNVDVTTGPLTLVKCHGGTDVCGLLQLGHDFNHEEMYGDNYGYRSGLNRHMVDHLRGKVARISSLKQLQRGDLVVDIGSNDGTTLNSYRQPGLMRVGIDPTAQKFRSFYEPGIIVAPEFFSAAALGRIVGQQQASVITSFAMFYDLPDPLAFMEEIGRVLADDGIWVFEQSYMPSMLETNSFDTVCHEHLEFYGLTQIDWMARRSGLEIVDVELNDVNGGSFSVVARRSSRHSVTSAEVEQILSEERAAQLDSLAPYRAFSTRAMTARDNLCGFVERARAERKTIGALGASTKGNVLLQYCGLGSGDILAAGDVNPDKFGCYTPGTWIPIVSQPDLLSMNPDYLLVLPWHFRDFFMKSDALRGFELVFPLPELAIVKREP